MDFLATLLHIFKNVSLFRVFWYPILNSATASNVNLELSNAFGGFYASMSVENSFFLLVIRGHVWSNTTLSLLWLFYFFTP